MDNKQFQKTIVIPTLALGSLFLYDLYRKYNHNKQLSKQLMYLETNKHSGNKDQFFEHFGQLNINQIRANTEKKKIIYKICITGGPQSGRTTAISTVRDVLTEKGFQVFLLPSNNQITFDQDKGEFFEKSLTYEKKIRLAQLNFKISFDVQAYFICLAQLSNAPSVLLSDGGPLDQTLDYNEQFWHDLQDLDDQINISNLRDNMFDAVIHLVTNADGDEKNFLAQDNLSISQSIAQDRKLQHQWNGHQEHKIFDNSDKDFKKKIERVIQFVQRFVGLPVTENLYRKYLLNQIKFPVNLSIVKFKIKDTFLLATTNSETEKVRSRVCEGAYQYQHIIRDIRHKNAFHEIKRPISASEYLQLLKRRDPLVQDFVRERRSFIYQNQCYLLDEVIINEKIGILKIETPKKGIIQKLPEFIGIDREVTDDPKFSSINMAKQQKVSN